MTLYNLDLLLLYRQKQILTFFLFLVYGFFSVAHSQTPNQKKPPLLSDDAYKAVSEFFEYERSTSLRPQIVQQVDSGTYFREKVVFDGWIGSRVVGYFAYPKTKGKTFPVVLLIDGITGSKDRWFQVDSWPHGGEMTQALINSGFAVFALDAPYHGERSYENDYQGPLNPFTHPSWDKDLLLRITIEHRRAIDYLFTRTEVDTTRIASLGHSLGGLTTFYLSAIDPRIKVGIAAVTPMMTLSPVLYVENFAKRVKSQPFLMLMGRQDFAYSVTDAQEMYEMITSKTKNLVFYDSGHRLPLEYIKTATEWLTKYLK